MEAIESSEKEVKKIHHRGKGAHELRPLTIASSSRPALRGYNAEMKALDKDLEIKLMEQLVGAPSKVSVIPIVGMGGIGKTTLARILFDSQLIKQSFDIRGWGTMSQTYNAREIVLGILEDIGVPLDGKKDAEQLLYQTLYGRMYLIVLEDVWTTQAWDDVKRVFPNDNGSRILLTTRHSQVAAYANSSSFYRGMQLLNEESSWSLLCQEIFQQNSCPPELVEVGKKITRQCQGLPLVLSAIDGHLKEETHTEEYWKCVSENVSLVLRSITDDPIFEVLTLSYNYLPYHLKAWFLYFGSFKDRAIDVSEVLKLWIAEGFVRPQIWNGMKKFSKAFMRRVTDRNHVSQRIWHEMEEVAEEYLRFFYGEKSCFCA